MSGRWRIDPGQLGAHDHLVLETGEGRRLALNDPRRFGSVDLVRTDALQEWPAIAALGPEPDALDPVALHSAVAGRSASIKQMLLDQSIVDGLGNIYVCEALHRSGIHPARAAGSVSPKRLRRLAPQIRGVIDEAIEAGGSTLRDFASPSGELGYFSKRFSVYDREGEGCACGGTVKRIVQGGRSTFYCRRCQH
jgi:formamidopyrimidine-DNA glycosylase